MSLKRNTSTFLLSFLLGVSGCGDKVTVNEVERGAEGESCRSRNDCQDGLMCLDMICRRGTPSPGPSDPSMDAGTIKTRSELGESCQTRADCLAPLACIENTCLMGFAPDAGVDTAPSHGKRGESCQASNDCDQGLSCIGSRCLESDFDLDFIPKQCYRVQCAASEDCCTNFKPVGFTQAQCDTMKSNCESAGVYPPPSVMPPAVTFNDCATWIQSCRCSMDCLEEQCLIIPGQFCLVDGQCTGGLGSCVNNRCVACKINNDCASTLLPYCTSNMCVQCKLDEHCTTTGSRCVAGTCQPGCTANEHCGLLQVCEAGECIDSGCTSDRQCYFLTGDDRSRCVNKKCQTPCAADAECTDKFHICSEGVCKFAGCDNDEECRAVLMLQSQPAMSLDRAVCRLPAP
jgi:hypothetical protein